MGCEQSAPASWALMFGIVPRKERLALAAHAQSEDNGFDG